MDLRRLKTILIFVLVAINLMLLVIIQNIVKSDREIKNEMRNNISALLAEDLIYLSPELEIPDVPETYNCYIEKMSANNRDLVFRFLDGEFTEEGEGIYRNGGKMLKVSNNEFKYENKNPEKAAKNFSQSAIENLCREEMESLGVLSGIYKFSGINYAKDNLKAIFTAQNGDSAFFDAYISFDVTEKGIIAISGKNLIADLSVSGTSSFYTDVMSLLPDLTKTPLLEEKKLYNIVSIKNGYYIGDNTESYRNILAIPVWQIATDSGNILYYDARNGRRVE